MPPKPLDEVFENRIFNLKISHKLLINDKGTKVESSVNPHQPSTKPTVSKGIKLATAKIRTNCYYVALDVMLKGGNISCAMFLPMINYSLNQTRRKQANKL